MNRPRLRWLVGAATGAALLGPLTPTRSGAHGLEPALLALRETRAGLFEVTWKSAVMRLPGADVHPLLPAHCREVSSPVATNEAERVRQRWTVDCGRDGLAGQSVGVADLAVAKIDALLRIERYDGTTIQTVLTTRAPSYTVPAAPSRDAVLRGYTSLGIARIFTGPELLFVLGLLLLATVSGRLIQTIAAFTVGHSISLSMSALHLAALPAGPVEVLIALSLLVLAVELARGARQDTLLRRFPWSIAFVFGLLHGLGFAGALVGAGLPPGAAPLALMSFNGGIEIGQLAFVGVALAAGVRLVRWRPAVAARAVRPAVYAMGILAAFWCFERVAVWLG